jgi:hypothetical protein
MATKKKAKAKIHKVRVLKIEKLAEEHHVIAAELEVQGPLPIDLLPPVFEPVYEVTPDAPDPVKRGFWAWLFGDGK